MIKPIKGNLPFNTNRFPFFYGWFLIFCGAIGMLMSLPGQTIGFSAYTFHLEKAYFPGFEKASLYLSIAYMIGTGVSSFLAPWIGRQYDKYGARIIAIFVSIGLAFSIVIISQFHKLKGLLKIGESFYIPLIFLSLVFFSMRFLGQGTLTMISKNMVMKWFDKNRGLANAFLGISIALGFNSSPKVLKLLNDKLGWDNGYLIIAAIVGILFPIFVFIFFRDNPETCSQKPDGNKVKKGKFDHKRKSTGKDRDLKLALKTYEFWVFNLVLALNALIITAVTFWNRQIFATNGLDYEIAISIFIPAAVIATIFQFGGSWLTDYIKLKYPLILEAFGLVSY